MLRCVMLNVPLSHIALVAVAIVVDSLFNVLMLLHFNFAIFFAALFNAALFHHFTI